VILVTIVSKNKVKIRLTDERWQHITASHKEIDERSFTKVTGVVENPDAVLKGDTGELLAVRKWSGKKMWVVVAYREVTLEDGFILTAYLTTGGKWLFKREMVWTKT